MEVLIYGVGKLIMLAIFLGVSALPAIIAYGVGRQFSARYLRWLLPCLVIALPIGWASAGYSAFKASCASLPTQAFVFAPVSAPEGQAEGAGNLCSDPENARSRIYLLIERACTLSSPDAREMACSNSRCINAAAIQITRPTSPALRKFYRCKNLHYIQSQPNPHKARGGI